MPLRFKPLLFLFLCACLPWRAPKTEPKKDTLLQRSFFLMGTVCEISAVSTDKASAEAAIEAGYRALVLVDDLMSDYKPESEISMLSREGFARPVVLSKETKEVLALSRHFSLVSSGAFDITVGPLVDLWRLAVKRQSLPTQEELQEALRHVSYQDILLDESLSEARLAKADMRLDLGGIAKGYTADLAREAMQASGAIGGRVNLGGQVLVFGEVPASLSKVIIIDPREPKKALYSLVLSDESISTTADYERGKVIGGKRFSHVFDPRTGVPIEGRAGAIIVSQRGVTADALSKVLYVSGEAGLSVITNEGGLALLVRGDGSMHIDEALQRRLEAP